MTEPRALLRAAITSRAAACKARDDAAVALKRAERIAGGTATERERASTSLARAENDHARVIARAIKTGGKPDMELSATIRTAQANLGEITSRARIAASARTELANELARAERALTEIEADVSQAALAVVIEEVETAAAPLDELLARLYAIDDLVFGVARLWNGNRAIALTDKLRQVVARLQPIRGMLATVRPQRVILTGSSEAEAAGKLENYRKALMQNPEATLAEIAAPEIKQPPLPPTNEIEAARTRGAMDVAAA